MKYKQYIVKKRFKGKGIGGHVNIPYGTICDVSEEFIYYNGVPICAVTSQNAFNYFWGYSRENPEQEIARQKAANQLFDSVPKDNGDELSEPKNAWNNYGELSQYGFGMYYWKWNDEIFDLSLDTIQYLLKCIEKGEAPLCFK